MARRTRPRPLTQYASRAFTETATILAQVTFGEGPQPDAELVLSAGGTARSLDSDWFNWPSYSRLRGGGCYAYQVDSASGSQAIVFRA